MKKTKLMLIIFTMSTMIFTGALKADSGIKAGLDISKFNLSKKGAYSGLSNEKVSNLKRLRFGIFHNFKITESVAIHTFYLCSFLNIENFSLNAN